MTRRTRLTCRGCEVLGLRIPRFEVREGELLRLIFPPRSTLLKLFESPELLMTNIDVVDGGLNARHPAFIPLVNPRARWRNFFRQQTASQWLTENSRLSFPQACHEVECMGINPHDSLGALAGNPRALLGLVSILHGDAGGIVFHTMAISRATTDLMFKTVLEQLGSRAGIYCQTHYRSQSRIILDEYDVPFSETIYLDDFSNSQPNRIAG